MTTPPKIPTAASDIDQRIQTIRGVRVILDRDLAALYGVTTGALNQAVRRNISRFPEDFVFQLLPTEFENWKSQFVISNSSAKMALRKPPYAFAEHGATMAAMTLSKPLAVEMSVFIVRAFIRTRTQPTHRAC